MPYLSSLGAKQIFRSFLSCKLYMHDIEKPQEVTLIFSKYQNTLLPITSSGERLQFVIAGPDENERRQMFNSSRAEES